MDRAMIDSLHVLLPAAPRRRLFFSTHGRNARGKETRMSNKRTTKPPPTRKKKRTHEPLPGVEATHGKSSGDLAREAIRDIDASIAAVLG
jgi:hypothetical protein